MGQVYKAKDLKLGRNVAVKVLPKELASESERLKRFEQEARAASALDHPNIVTIHDIAEAEGRHFIVMQLVEGVTLGELLQRGHLDLKKSLDYAIQIADGLAKLMEPSEWTEASTRDLEGPHTKEGHIVGTAPYMSPEQAQGKKVDARSDIFSLGSVLYEMVTGRRALRRERFRSFWQPSSETIPRGCASSFQRLPSISRS